MASPTWRSASERRAFTTVPIGKATVPTASIHRPTRKRESQKCGLGPLRGAPGSSQNAIANPAVPATQAKSPTTIAAIATYGRAATTCRIGGRRPARGGKRDAARCAPRADAISATSVQIAAGTMISPTTLNPANVPTTAVIAAAIQDDLARRSRAGVAARTSGPIAPVWQ